MNGRNMRSSCDKKSRFLFTFPWLSEEIPISPIQRFQPPMTQSQEIDGLAEFDLKLDPKYRAVAWHGTIKLITRAPATEETEEIQGGTYASFIDIDDEREKYAV